MMSVRWNLPTPMRTVRAPVKASAPPAMVVTLVAMAGVDTLPDRVDTPKPLRLVPLMASAPPSDVPSGAVIVILAPKASMVPAAEKPVTAPQVLMRLVMAVITALRSEDWFQPLLAAMHRLSVATTAAPP